MVYVLLYPRCPGRCVFHVAGAPMTVELALEIPIALLKDIYPLTDLGFSLAHMVLKHPKYREFYQGKSQILDNSMYELDEPLTVDELLNATRAVMPTAVIAPDWMDDAPRTSTAALLMRNHFQGISFKKVGLNGEPSTVVKPTVGVVVQGKDLRERINFFHWCVKNEFSPICFPFRNREQRRTLLGALLSDNEFQNGKWYHLLGLNNAGELELAGRMPGRWSVDTAKPCKPELDMRGQVWSGHPKLDHMRGYTPEEVERVKENIHYLRSFL